MLAKGLGILPICRTSVVGINVTQKRTSFYEKYKHGPNKISNPTPDYIQWVKDFFGPEGVKYIKEEARRTFLDKPFRSYAPKRRKINETVIFEHFDSEESIKRWKPVADSDSLNGFSTSHIKMSPNGHALFTGFLDTRLPDDGMTCRSGFAGIIGPQAERDKLYAVETQWNWGSFNCLEIKFRGDGRKYMVILNTGSYTSNLSYYDAFGFPLYTRGGPYWQTVRIPLSKFIYSAKGLIQDSQGMFPTFAVKFVAITLTDNISGPFSLEIDHIGLRLDVLGFQEYSAYESYSFPHIQYKPLQVSCDPPDPDK